MFHAETEYSRKKTTPFLNNASAGPGPNDANDIPEEFLRITKKTALPLQHTAAVCFLLAREHRISSSSLPYTDPAALLPYRVPSKRKISLKRLYQARSCGLSIWSDSRKGRATR